jgi:hypothetical protein
MSNALYAGLQSKVFISAYLQKELMTKLELNAGYGRSAGKRAFYRDCSAKIEKFPDIATMMDSHEFGSSMAKIKILLLSSTTHPFVEELRNQLNKNEIKTALICLRGLRAVRFGLIGDAFLFLGRL